MNLEQIQSLSQKIERILESSRVLKAENYRLNEKNTNLQQKLSEIQIQVDNTNELLKRKEEERFVLEERFDEISLALDESKNLLEVKDASLIEKLSTIELLSSEKESLEKELQEAVQTKDSLQQNLNGKLSEITLLKQDIETNQQEIARLNQELDTSLNSLSEKNQEIQNIQEKLQQAESEAHFQKDELFSKEELIQKLQEENENLRNDNESLNETLQEVQQKFEDLNSMLQNTLDLEITEPENFAEQETPKNIIVNETETEENISEISEEPVNARVVLEEVESLTDTISESAGEQEEMIESAAREEFFLETEPVPEESFSQIEESSDLPEVQTKPVVEEISISKEIAEEYQSEALELDFSEPMQEPAEEKQEIKQEPEKITEKPNNENSNYFRLKWMMSNDPFGVGSK